MNPSSQEYLDLENYELKRLKCAYAFRMHAIEWRQKHIHEKKTNYRSIHKKGKGIGQISGPRFERQTINTGSHSLLEQRLNAWVGKPAL